MPSSRKTESSRRTSSRSGRRSSATSEKVRSNLRKASERVKSLEKVMGNRSLSSERRLRHYSKTRETCKNLVELGDKNKLTQREQDKSERYRSELNRISSMMKQKSMEKIRSAKRSGSRSAMRKAAETADAVAKAIHSSELSQKSQLLNKMASASNRRQSEKTYNAAKTQQICRKLNADIRNLKKMDMRSSEFNMQYTKARNYAKAMREAQNKNRFGSGARSEMVNKQIEKLNRLSSETKNFHLQRLSQLKKSSSERQSRILRSAYDAANSLESKSLKSATVKRTPVSKRSVARKSVHQRKGGRLSSRRRNSIKK